MSGMQEAAAEHWTPPFRAPQAARLLILSILTFAAATALWIALAEVDTVTRVPGRLVVDGDIKRLSHLEGGVVRAILVRDGDFVSAGQPIIELDPVVPRAEFGRTTAKQAALRIRIARLEAELGRAALRFDPELERSAPELIQAELSLYRLRASERSATIDAGRARRNAAEQAFEEARARAASDAAAASASREQLAIIRPLAEKGIEPRLELVRAEAAADAAARQAAQSELAAGRAAAALREAQAESAAIVQRLDGEVNEALAAARIELALLTESAPALADRLRRSTIRAPVAGHVNNLVPSTIGAVVKPGEPVADLVPAGRAIIVEATVPPDDIGEVAEGQRARIRLTALDEGGLEVAEGAVAAVSPDVRAGAEPARAAYVARIHLTTPVPGLKPGMEVEVLLLGPRRTILSYLVPPLEHLGATALRER